MRESMTFKSRHGDLHWYQHSATYVEIPRRSTWQFGNRQERKKATSEFAKYSSLHGIHFICSRDRRASKTKKIFFRLFFAFCLISSFSNVAFLAQESWSTESVYVAITNKEAWNGPQEDIHFPKYPRITFCRRPAYKVHENNSERLKLLEYAFLSLSYPFVSLTPQERSLLVGIKLFRMQHGEDTLPEHLRDMDSRLQSMKRRYEKFKSKQVHLNLTQLIVDNSARSDEIFVHCIAFLIEINCTEIFRPVLTNMGICFSLLVEEAAAIMANLETILIFDLHAVQEIDKALDVGYEIYLSDPRNYDGIVNSVGETLLNGYTTIMKTSLTMTSRSALFTPWHGLYTQCPRLPPELDLFDYDDRFFKPSCEGRYMERLITKHCQCKFVTSMSISSERVCEPADIHDCFVNLALFDNLTGLAHTCGFPCIEYGYDSKVSLVKLGDQNISRLIFIYDDKQYALREYRKTTLSSFLSQIGGALGLYLGASIITVVEMVTFAAAWLWYTCAPSKRKANTIVLERKKQHFY